MIICPNCKKELADGTKFCIGCGTSVEQAAPVVVDTPVEDTTADVKKTAFDMSKVLGALKAVPVKMWAIGGGIILAAVVIIVAVMVLLGSAPKDKYVVYLKDGELYMNMLDGKESFELTEKFTGEDVSKDSIEVLFARHLIRVSADGKTVFYPEKWDADSYEFDLYYRSTTNGKAEGERLAKSVSGYAISADGKSVFYVSDGTIYKHNLKEKEEIEDNVGSCWFAMDGKSFVYTDSDYDLHLWKDGESERLAKGVSVLYVNEEVTKIFYKDREGDLYLWNGAEDAVKVDEDVYNLITGYDNGGAYYLKVNSTITTMADYIIDDYVASDAAMVEPVYPYSSNYEWPTRPDYVYSWDYDTYEEYQAAYAQYEIDYAQYLVDYDAVAAQYQADLDQYYIDYDAWSAKSDRDYYRQYFDSYQYNISSFSLYFYDGTKTELVADNVNQNSLNNYEYRYLSGSQAPVMTYYTSKPVEGVKINISEMISLSYADSIISNSLETSVVFAVASGADSKEIVDGLVRDIYLGLDGKHVYYTTYNDYESSVLYEVSTDGTVSEATEYETEVEYVWGTLSNGDIVYFKDYDYDDEAGTLYIAKEKVEKDVCNAIAEVNGGEAIYLWTDSNGDEGMLCYYDGKNIKEIQDDVSVLDYAITKEGGIIYLVDYSHSKEEGELYYSVDGKEGTVIDEDVVTIISPYGQ